MQFVIIHDISHEMIEVWTIKGESGSRNHQEASAQELVAT
jgi:hypothetical protein